MSAAARRHGPVTLAEIDPDLDQTVEEMRWKVSRYHQLGPMIIEATNDPQLYRTLAARIDERGDLFETFRSRAEKLGIKSPYALIRLVEVAAALTKAPRGQRKSPAANAVLANLKDGIGYAERAASDARVEFIIAQREAKKAAAKLAALGEALQYVEASLG